MNVCLWAYWYQFANKNADRKWHLCVTDKKKTAVCLNVMATSYARVGPVFKIWEGKVRAHP